MRLFAVATLAVSVLAGSSSFAGAVEPAAPSAAPANEAERAKTIEGLKSRLKSLEDAAKGDVCADPVKVRALLDEGKDAGKSENAPIKSSGPTSPDASQGVDHALSKADLVKKLQQSVVLIIAGSDSGSGFLINADTVVTNNHVVASAEAGQPVVVVGRGVIGARKASIIASVGGSDGPGGRDYAILKVPGLQAKETLALSRTASELTDVVAAGFPGLLLDNDVKFRNLIKGDLSSMPELAVSQGAIMALQNKGTGMPTIAHSAPISGGNSGGPLVDRCGRVVGINTFINVSVDQASHAGFAIAAEDVVRYLGENGITPDLRENRCE